jgi:hypothetical protein
MQKVKGQSPNPAISNMMMMQKQQKPGQSSSNP